MRIALKAQFRRLQAALEGATSIEYALIAAGIAIAILATVSTLGSKVNGMFTAINGILS
jgi:pilus assembly protein Flp/PilA